jgi:transposase
MTMTIVEAARGVTGGVDTHLDVHVAAALDPLGGLLGTERFETNTAGRFETNTAGYKALLAWLESFGDVTKIGIEGTGSYGSGLPATCDERV